MSDDENNKDVNREEEDEEEVEERDEEEPEKKTPVRKKPVEEDDEEEPEQKKPVRGKKPVEEDDEEDEKVPAQPNPPKSQPASSKRHIEEDDEYDEDEKGSPLKNDKGSSSQSRDRENKKNTHSQDDEDEYSAGSDSANIPSEFRHFLGELRKALREKHIYELQTLYEQDFYELTDRHFKGVRLPSLKQVTDYIGEDKHCQVLYKELYFRHVYQKIGPTVDDRFDSFENYIDLLDILLGLKLDKPEIDLPIQWLWDILDEFIYQFRSFHEFRTDFRRQNLDEKDLDLIKQHQHLWSAQTVIEYLHELAKKGGIDLSKSWFRRGGSEDKIQHKTDGISELFITLSQFSLIGLSRVYCLLGDYTSSIKVLDSIDLANKSSPFHSTLAAKVTLYYYLGFAYLMLRRYADAVKTFSYFLVYVNRNKHSFPRSIVQDVVEQTVVKMYGLLAIANSLSPQTLDESLGTQLKDRLKSGWTPEGLFESSCPNFICPAPPDYAAPAPPEDTDPSRLSPAGRLQKRIFANEIKQRSNLPQTYNYLKMCTNVHIS